MIVDIPNGQTIHPIFHSEEIRNGWVNIYYDLRRRKLGRGHVYEDLVQSERMARLSALSECFAVYRIRIKVKEGKNVQSVS